MKVTDMDIQVQDFNRDLFETGGLTIRLMFKVDGKKFAALTTLTSDFVNEQYEARIRYRDKLITELESRLDQIDLIINPDRQDD